MHAKDLNMLIVIFQFFRWKKEKTNKCHIHVNWASSIKNQKKYWKYVVIQNYIIDLIGFYLHTENCVFTKCICRYEYDATSECGSHVKAYIRLKYVCIPFPVTIPFTVNQKFAIVIWFVCVCAFQIYRVDWIHSFRNSNDLNLISIYALCADHPISYLTYVFQEWFIWI